MQTFMQTFLRQVQNSLESLDFFASVKPDTQNEVNRLLYQLGQICFSVVSQQSENFNVLIHFSRFFLALLLAVFPVNLGTTRQRITGKLFIPSIPFFTLILLNYAPCGQIH